MHSTLPTLRTPASVASTTAGSARTVTTQWALARQTLDHSVGVLRTLHLACMAVLDLLVLLVVLLSVCLVPVGVGLLLLPHALDLSRARAQRHRNLAEQEGAVVGRYRKVTPHQGPLGITSLSRRLEDPLVLQDLLWTALNSTVGLCVALLPTWLLWWSGQGLVHAVGGVFDRHDLLTLANGSVYQFLSNQVVHTTYVPHLVLALLLVAAALWSAPRVVRAHRRGVVTLLGTASTPTTGQLRERVGHLAQTRQQALDHQESEIERIERDLHDGAQARLVALGMDLNQISRLVHADPDRAVQLLDRAKTQPADALTELRQLVRGVRPPVLADRGLVEAVRALAATVPVPTQVRSELDHRLAHSLETALYFCVAELVTNAVKHADAERITVEIGTGGTAMPGQVTVTVTDDGIGGVCLPAPPQSQSSQPDQAGRRGRSGLEGVQRRLAAFDGELHLHSPAGGPTTVWLFVPDLSERG